MTNQAARERLGGLLPGWQQLLKGWAANGRLSAAAREALQLEGEPPLLKELSRSWAAGDFSALPPVELLSAVEINGAMGAYAISTETIYINQDWLLTASQAQLESVLTEELGHHLDGLLNASDTPGDEGALFAAVLQRGGVISTQQREQLLEQNDHGTVLVGGAAHQLAHHRDHRIEHGGETESGTWWYRGGGAEGADGSGGDSAGRNGSARCGRAARRG